MRNIQKHLGLLPDTPGVYFFYNKKKKIIYVGKATSLRDRVRSYFPTTPSPLPATSAGRLLKEGTGRPIEEMIHEVKDIKWKQTDSVLEAILLEGEYIKKFRPKYNVDWRDDKSWNYIGITDEEYPRVVTVREHELKYKVTGQLDNLAMRQLGFLFLFGPYPGLNTRATMKLLRRLFF
ncbi:MAG: GIY-YIG nuclease family protein, partial [Patescibacteria group bacterium]